MQSKFNTKKARKLLYVGLLIALFFWTIYGATNYWKQNFSSTASNNRAILVDINNGLANLPKPDIIVPGKTSGNANPVISNYLASQNTISGMSIEQANLFLHGYKTFSLAALNDRSQNVLNDINTELYNTTNIIDATQKFIEYNPKIDLAPLVNGKEQNDQGRINRTKAGIKDVINSVQTSGYGRSAEIEAILSPLPIAADQITANNVEIWYNTVEKAQKDIIAIISSDFESIINESSARIAELSANYLE